MILLALSVVAREAEVVGAPQDPDLGLNTMAHCFYPSLGAFLPLSIVM